MIEFSESEVRRSEVSTTAWVISYILTWIILIIIIISLWKIFIKAGKSGWPACIPVYNIIILLEIIGKPLWWVLFYFIPIANLIIHVIVMCALGDRFEKSTRFKIGLIFLPIIFLPILATDDSRYIPPTNEENNLSKL